MLSLPAETLGDTGLREKPAQSVDDLPFSAVQGQCRSLGPEITAPESLSSASQGGRRGCFGAKLPEGSEHSSTRSNKILKPDGHKYHSKDHNPT